MKQKRKRYSADFKARVVLEALKEQKTLSELASEYELHPNQISEWKKRFLEGASSLFSNQRAKTEKDFEKERDRLYRQIGQLNMDLDYLKKKVKVELDLHTRRQMVEKDHAKLSISRQCKLLSLHRSGLYYVPRERGESDLELMQLIDRKYLESPWFGTRRMREYLRRLGYGVGRKLVQRLYRLMGIEAIYPKPRLSKPGKGHKVYPYLLRNLKIDHANQVWASDITYIPMQKGFMYLVAIIDLHSRFVVDWGVSNSLEAGFCVDVLKRAIERNGKPQIFNTDQGAQFTSEAFTSVLEQENIAISMDGRGRFLDNILIERLWRSVKYEYVYINAPENGTELYKGLDKYFLHYNEERFHQSLNYQTPDEVYRKTA